MMAVHADRHHVRWSIRMIKKLSILAVIAGLSFLSATEGNMPFSITPSKG
jgi:hypothetical protein